MLRLLLGRILPAGAAVGLLMSSASPIQPALRAFEDAASALGGNEAVDSSDLAMPDEAAVEAALKGGGSGAGFSLSRMFKNLFGPSDSDRAKAQLDQIIANVKSRSAAPAPPPTAAARPSKKGPSRAPAKVPPARTAGTLPK